MVLFYSIDCFSSELLNREQSDMSYLLDKQFISNFAALTRNRLSLNVFKLIRVE
jgi:hypothetical protein